MDTRGSSLLPLNPPIASFALHREEIKIELLTSNFYHRIFLSNIPMKKETLSFFRREIRNSFVRSKNSSIDPTLNLIEMLIVDRIVNRLNWLIAARTRRLVNLTRVMRTRGLLLWAGCVKWVERVLRRGTNPNIKFSRQDAWVIS